MVVLNIVSFHPYLPKWSNLTSIFFSNGLVQPPTLIWCALRFVLLPPKATYSQGIPNQPNGRQDVLGFARLNRASLVVDAMASCPKAKWKSFISEPWVDVRTGSTIRTFFHGKIKPKRLKGSKSLGDVGVSPFFLGGLFQVIMANPVEITKNERICPTMENSPIMVDWDLWIIILDTWEGGADTGNPYQKGEHMFTRKWIIWTNHHFFSGGYLFVVGGGGGGYHLRFGGDGRWEVRI